jgi:hypothetical protein
MASELNEAEFSDDIANGFAIYRWPQGPRIAPTFRKPESTFIFGDVDTGKSRLAVRLAMLYQARSNAQIIDAFGAENDSESTVWILRPKTRDSTLMLVGDSVQIDGWDNVMPISQYTFESTQDYSVVVTDRALFGPYSEKRYDAAYYAALSRIFELAKRREGQRRLAVLLIREAWNIIYSQIRAGISRDEQYAMMEFRKMHSQRAHARMATIMDTQRYTDLSASVRTLVNYRYVKGFGAQPIPHELDFLFKPKLFGSLSGRTFMLRNTPRDRFVLITKNNGVAIGWYKDVSWHVKKGNSPLKKLGITVSVKPGETTPSDAGAAGAGGAQNDDERGRIELHKKMAELREAGMGYEDIAKKLGEDGTPVSWTTVRYHLTGRCQCFNGDDDE